MTKTEFKTQHGTEWAKFSSRPIYRALMELAHEDGPAMKPGAITPGDIVVGGHVLYAEIRGYEKFRELLNSLSQPEQPELPEPDYKGEPEKPE